MRSSSVSLPWVRLGSTGQLWHSRYGWLVLAKVATLAVLGGFGWWHRRRYARAIAAQRPAPGFIRFVLAQVAVMAATVGLATALSRTPTPVQPLTDHADCG